MALCLLAGSESALAAGAGPGAFARLRSLYSCSHMQAYPATFTCKPTAVCGDTLAALLHVTQSLPKQRPVLFPHVGFVEKHDDRSMLHCIRPCPPALLTLLLLMNARSKMAPHVLNLHQQAVSIVQLRFDWCGLASGSLQCMPLHINQKFALILLAGVVTVRLAVMGWKQAGAPPPRRMCANSIRANCHLRAAV